MSPSMLYWGYEPKAAKAFFDRLYSPRGSNPSPFPRFWLHNWLRFQALFDPKGAIKTFNEQAANEKDRGDSLALTHQWIHTFDLLGNQDTQVYADSPLGLVLSRNNNRTCIAFNPTDQNLDVRFIHRPTLKVVATLTLKPREMRTIYVPALDVPGTILQSDLKKNAWSVDLSQGRKYLKKYLCNPRPEMPVEVWAPRL
jgi:hypothetical protein